MQLDRHFTLRTWIFAGSSPARVTMVEVLERRLRRYIEGKISLNRFYHWYMQWKGWVNEEGTGIEDNPDEDTRVTLVIYEFTSEPIASDPCREEWLKRELSNILELKGRWKNTEG